MSYAIGIDYMGREFKIESFFHSYYQEIVLDLYTNHKFIKSIIVYDEDNKIKHLWMFDINLETIKIIGGKNITDIECENNKLTNLDLSMCDSLQYLECDIELENNIKLPDNHKLEYIYYE